MRRHPHFRDSLQVSNSVAEDSRWTVLYRNAWPELDRADYVTDQAMQRGGIDRVITLRDGSAVTVEEKYDIRADKNFFLEIWSSLEAQTPGWIRKPLKCDCVAYVCPAIYAAYLLPWGELQAAWVAFASDWVHTYQQKYVRNPAYTTVGVAVPITEVLRAVPGTRVFDWPESEPVVTGAFSLGGKIYSRY